MQAAMTIPFLKMHGAGNDFVVIDERKRSLDLSPEQVRRLSDRRLGIGCDQFITLHPPPPNTDADLVMRIRNPDGSEAGACGNATRCVAELLFEQTGLPFQLIRTIAGDLPAERLGDGRFRVDMGPAGIGWQQVPLLEEMDTLHLPLPGDPAACSMGNPHATFFVDDLEVARRDGPWLRCTRSFRSGPISGRAGAVLRPAAAAGVGAWGRADAGLRLRRVCRGGECAAPGADGRPSDRGDGWRNFGDRHHRRRAGADGRAGGDELSGGGRAVVVEVVTFGCRLNTVESAAIRSHAAHLEGTVVFNTCAVTAAAEREARQAIGRLHRERPEVRIVVTGCAAQIEPGRWAALPGVVRVLGNQEKLSAKMWRQSGSAVGDIRTARGHVPAVAEAIEGRARAFVDVQQGCDHACTFCIIPQGRGPSRSVPATLVVERIRHLVEAGVAEMVLTGVDLASWNEDGAGLGALVRRVLRDVPGLRRLRLSSIDPAAFDDALWDALGNEERLMPHLHLSVQAGADLVLKRMRRRHSRAGALAVIERARAVRPGVAIGADLIAGFPTETDGLAAETLGFVQAAAIPYVHVFPYSARRARRRRGCRRCRCRCGGRGRRRCAKRRGYMPRGCMRGWWGARWRLLSNGAGAAIRKGLRPLGWATRLLSAAWCGGACWRPMRPAWEVD